MALLPPMPVGMPPDSSYWNDWYEKLRLLINSLSSAVPWSIITGKPTTLAGYGITDAQSKLNNSAGLAAALSDETGSGLAVFNTSPTLVTPSIGAATGTSLALGGGTALTTTNRTGTGNLVLQTSPSLTTPDIGVATGTSVNLSGAATVGGALTVGTTTLVASGGTVSYAGREVGYRDHPQNVQAAPYTVVAADRGTDIVMNTNSTVTINSGVFSGGQWFRIVNNSGAALSTAGTANTRLGGSASVGARTIANNGVAEVLFVSGATAIVWGVGVT